MQNIAYGSTEEREEQIKTFNDYLFGFSNPDKFYGSDGVEATYTRNFESMCILIADNLSQNPKKLTVIEYYQAFLYLKQKSKPKGSKK